MADKKTDEIDARRERLTVPVLHLRERVIFPRATGPVNVSLPRATRLVQALPPDERGRLVVLALLRPGSTEDEPGVDGLYPIATLARLTGLTRLRRQGADHLLVAAGVRRVRILRETRSEPFVVAEVELLEDVVPATPDLEYLALRDTLRRSFAEYVERSPTLSDELAGGAADIDDASVLGDYVAAAVPALTVARRQQLLGMLDVRSRLRTLVDDLARENEKLDIEEKIQKDIQKRVTGQQREFLLREQLKAIHQELGDGSDVGQLDELRRKLDLAGLPDEPRREAMRELRRLGQIPSGSSEHTVVRNYLEWLASLPWRRSTARAVDLALAERILDEDHHGLEKVKARILEHLAVARLRRQIRGPILCFVGPPGVGKTSLGRSIARSMGRQFARISLGGMHDEAELRGHRRTYVGAMPGQVIQALRRVGANDPVLMLDEVDKIGRDFRGDPAAALLEVLDPEQNATFRDHYLDMPFDLSNVLFIATANVLDPIPDPLLDRMEVIELSGYSEEEKLSIAQRYLVPDQVRESGLPPELIGFTDDGLSELARHYTHEAGVRGLEREIGSICRKQARRLAGGQERSMTVTTGVIRELLGSQRYRIETEIAERLSDPGVAVGLAFTPRGGDILFIEANIVHDGRGQLIITGQIGDVMQESARAAVTWLRANAARYGWDGNALKNSDVHIHVPAGAVPKDGPSAGVVMVIAIASALARRPVRADLAMTGEITLSGHVLPVGGIREKLLAARRCGLRAVVLPEMNEVNVHEDLPAQLRGDIALHFVRTIDEALSVAFGTLVPARNPFVSTSSSASLAPALASP